MLTWLFWPHLGGVEKHVLQIAKRLVQRGHQVRIFTQKHDHSLISEENLDGIEVFRFPKNNLELMERRHIWNWFFKNSTYLKWADLIHCHDLFTFNYWFLPFRLLYPKKPIFMTYHGFEESFPLQKKLIYFRRFGALLTQGNICIGHFLPKWYGHQADFISYGGTDIPNSYSETNQGYAVFIGRLKPDTGILYYLEALRLLKERKIEILLKVCGDGPLRARVVEFAKKENLMVELLGFVQSPEAILASSQAAFVSGYLSMLEAMAYKKLVFSVYDNPLKKDYLEMMPGSNKMFNISKNASDLADKIQTFWNTPDIFSEKIEKAYQFAQMHSWDRLVDLYLDLYRQAGLKI